MTDDEIYTAVHSIINAVTGIAGTNIIPADDNENAPSGSYASIRVGASRGQRGQANQTKTDSGLVASPIGDVRDVVHNIKAQLTVDVAINFYRDDALEFASRLYQANKRPDVSALLYTAGIGWRQASVVNNLTSLQSQKREERALITITLLYEHAQQVTTNAIYTVPISAENENGDTIQTATISAPVGV